MKYLVIDTETTGVNQSYVSEKKPLSLTKQSEIIQIAGLALDEHYQVLHAFSFYCDAITATSSDGAFKTHRLDLQDIRSKVPMQFFSVIADTKLQILFEPDIMFIGKKVGFDMNMIGAGCRNCVSEWVKPKQTIRCREKHGRHMLDLNAVFRKRLSMYDNMLKEGRDKFFSEHTDLQIWGNSPELYLERKNMFHDAFYDVINTYLLFEQMRKESYFGGEVYGR